MKLVTVNIEGDSHLDLVSQFLVKEKADVVCMQELFKVDIPRFERELGMKSYYAPQSIIKKLINPRLEPKGEWGVAVFAKDFADAEHYYYADPSGVVPEFSGIVTGVNNVVISARCTIAGQLFDIATTHFTWSMDGEKDEKQIRDMKGLLSYLNKRKPDIICGDFNAPLGGEVRNMLAAVYRDNIPPDTKTTIDNALHKDGSQISGGIQLAVDGMFSSEAVSVSNLRIVSGVSDHMAIVGEVEKSATV